MASKGKVARRQITRNKNDTLKTRGRSNECPPWRLRQIQTSPPNPNISRWPSTPLNSLTNSPLFVRHDVTSLSRPCKAQRHSRTQSTQPDTTDRFTYELHLTTTSPRMPGVELKARDGLGSSAWNPKLIRIESTSLVYGMIISTRTVWINLMDIIENSKLQ